MSEARPLVSIVVPCRNEAGHIRAFLDAVLAQETEGFEWEVIVADGMSDDGTRQVLAEYAARQPRLRVLDNPEKIVSTGLNRAIRAAQGDIVIRMDVHTRYASDYVRQCVAVLRETGADNVGGPWIAEGRGYIGRVITAASLSCFGVGWAPGHNPFHEGPVDTVYLGCWRKETLERLGLFDESLVRNQDDELNLRIVRSGGVVWQSRRIRSWYRPRNSLKALFRQYFQYGFWKVAVIRKHKLPASLRHLVPGAFVGANLGLPLLWGIAHAVDATTAGVVGWLWLGQAGLYVAASLAASFLAAASRGWDLLPLLPVVFATYHVSYGLGFLAGLVHFGLRRRCGQPARLFTALSR